MTSFPSKVFTMTVCWAIMRNGWIRYFYSRMWKIVKFVNFEESKDYWQIFELLKIGMAAESQKIFSEWLLLGMWLWESYQTVQYFKNNQAIIQIGFDETVIKFAFP